MKRCKYCNVAVETEKDFCPLCFNRLENCDGEIEFFYNLREKNETTKRTSSFLYRLFIFISICIVSICLIINLLTTPKYLWSLVVICSVLYVWVLVAHTIISKQTVFKKVFLQILSILLLLYFTEKISAYSWLLSFVYPSVAILAIFVMLMFLFIRKNRKEYLIGFSFISLCLNLASILFVALKFDVFVILNLINIIICSLSFIGMLIFGFSAMITELRKKWHL